MSDLNFDASVDLKNWRASIQEMRRDLLGLNNTVSAETQKMDSAFKNLSLGLAGYFSGQALLGFTQKLINVRGEFQKTEIAFTTMLGSAEKSKVLMGQMVDLAAKTPFGLQDVTNGAKQLLAFQIPAEQVVNTLTRLGNVAAGLGVPMGQLIHVYGQVKAQGKLMTNDLYQFMNAGIPMTAELAKVMGVTESKVKDLITAGKVGFPEVQKVIANLTDEGGMFFNLMEAQSASLSGQIANLEDAFDQLLNKIGEDSQDFLSGSIDEITYLVENYQKVIEVLEGIVLMYGAYKAALIAQTAILNVAAAREAGFTIAMMGRLTATALVDKATKALNTTMLANPYAIAAALIVGLTYALVKMANQLSYAEAAQDRLNKKLTEAGSSTAEQKAKIEALVTAIKSENTTNERREVLLKQIKTLANGRLDQLTVETIRTGKATEAINGYISALDRQAKAKAYTDLMSENYKRIAEIDSRKNSTYGERVASTFDAATYQDKNGNTTFSSVLKGLGKKSEDAIKDNEQKEKAALLAQNENIKKIIGKNAGDLADSYSQGGGKVAEGVGKSESKVKEANEKHQRELAEVFSKGSISDLEQRISLWNNALQRASLEGEGKVKVRSKNKYGDEKETGETVSVAYAVKQVEALEKAKAEAEKKIRKLSFDEELAETERQWNVRYQIAKQYGEDIAKAQFADLKGDSYFDDITAKYKTLDDKLKSGVGVSDEDIKQWQKLKEILDSLNGVKDPFTNFTDGLDEELSKLSTYAEKMEFLNKQLYSPEIMSGEGIDNKHKAEIIKRLDAQKKEWESYYKSLLESQKTYEEKSDELQKQYAAVKNSDEYKNGTDADRKKVDEEFKKRLSDITIEILKNSDSWVKAFDNLDKLTSRELQSIISEFEKAKDGLAKTLTPEDFKVYMDALNKLKDQARSKNPFPLLASAAKSFFNDLKQGNVNIEKLNELLKETQSAGSFINEMAGEFQKMSDSLGLNIDTSGFQDTVTNITGAISGIGQAYAGFASGDIISGVKGVMQTVTSIGNLFNGDKKRERNIKKWAAAVNELKNEYTELAYAVEKAMGTEKYDNQNAQIKNLKEQQATLEKMYNEESKKKKKDQGKLDDYKNQIADINRQIQDITDDMVSNILQTDVKSLADSLGDALLAAWQKGASGADAYKDVAKKAMQDAVLNALKMSILEPQLKAFTDQMLSSMGYHVNSDGTVSGSFDGLTSQEQQNLQDMMGQVYSQFEQAMSGYTDLFGVGDAENSSLEGAIKGVSEETASIIAGQMNAIRVNQGQMLVIQQQSFDVMRNQLLELTKIEYNTRYIYNLYQSFDSLTAGLRAKGLV